MKKTKLILKQGGFICTDASKETEQWVKKITETKFQVYERHADVMSEIDLDDYPESELEDYIIGYYNSLDELKKLYGKDSNMVIAECISESDLV